MPLTPPTYVTITDHFQDGSGNPLAGRVIFRPSVSVKHLTASIPPAPVICQITSGGDLTVQLVANNGPGITPVGWTYEVIVITGPPGSAGIPGVDGWTREIYSIALPSAPSSVVLRDLTKVNPVPPFMFDVKTVAGVGADVGGNVPLTASDLALAGVGFASQAAVDALTATVAGKQDNPPAGDNLDTWLTGFDTHLSSGQSYADPTGPNVTDFLTGLAAIARGDTTSALLTALGFTIQTGVEAVTKRRYTLVYNEYGTTRCWGAYLIDMTSPRFTGLVQAPHTVFDVGSEFMALQTWRDQPGTMLLISGSHRTDTTGTNPRDVAHNTSSLYHQVALKYLAYGMAQLAQHGYDDATDASHDVIVSSGAANAGLAIRRVADCLELAGFRTARSWVDTGNVLLGTTDVQGLAAATAATAFCHIEVNNTVRTTPALLAKYKLALTSANYFGTVDTAWDPLALGVTGQFPSSLGSANSAGTSPYQARADHTHRATSDTPVNGNTIMRVAGAWTSQTPAQVKTTLAVGIADVTALQAALDDNSGPPSPESATLGDYVSSVPRWACSASDTLTNQVLTLYGAIAMRSFSSTKIRFHVRTAVGSPGIVTAALFKGTSRASLAKVGSDITVTTQFGSTGPKELAVSSFAVTKGDWCYLALLHTNAGTDPAVSVIASGVSTDLMNPASTQVICGFKTAQASIPASSVDMTTGWTIYSKMAWWSLAA